MPGNWYRAYGLTIQCDIALLLPPVDAGGADVTIRVGESKPTEPGEGWLSASPREIRCVRPPAGSFVVRDGREILVNPFPDVNPELLGQWIQSAAISLMLHQRGFLVLHASVVTIGNSAVAFLGEVGQGKSTTAAALHARGHRLICDDVAAIRFDTQDTPLVVPGVPFLKLTPQAVTAMGENPHGMSRVPDDSQKLLRILNAPPDAATAPLRAVYILGEGETCQIEPLPAQTALTELMHHAFVARFTDFLNSTATAASHFRHCTQVVKCASISRLLRPKSLVQLPALAQAVERHFAGIMTERT